MQYVVINSSIFTFSDKNLTKMHYQIKSTDVQNIVC
jgi:hypothetical protein